MVGKRDDRVANLRSVDSSSLSGFLLGAKEGFLANGVAEGGSGLLRERKASIGLRCFDSCGVQSVEVHGLGVGRDDRKGWVC